ncbi:hypothetical protein GS463_29830 [Rhodococcus hoagii]|nr:hypothetical protein [Prescottella equi]NKW20426.1 hypothetical protein [Prescottella equi]
MAGELANQHRPRVAGRGVRQPDRALDPGNKALWAPKQWLDWSQYPQQYRPDAFRVTGWSDDNSYAVIEYALRDMRTGTQTGWFTARFEVVWQDGDWKLRRPSTQLPPQNLTSLAGWTQW